MSQPLKKPSEPTREQLLTEGLLVAQRLKWEGWTWKDYQKAIVRLNYKVSELEAAREQNERMFARAK